MKQNIWGLLLLTIILGYSCINDDRSDCPKPVNIRIQFSYTHNMPGSDLFRQEVDTLSVIVYNNADDSYMARYRVAQDQLENGNILTANDLNDGDYTLVAWGKNRCEDYMLRDYNTTKNNMHADLIYSSGQVHPSTGNLFHGMCRLVIRKRQGYAALDLIKNTSKITVRLADREASTANPIQADDYKIEITAKNGSYKYDNTLTANNPQLDYIQQYSVTAHDTLKAESKMLRLYPDDESRIQIKDRAGNIVPIIDEKNNPVTTPVSLTKQLMKNPFINSQEDLDRRDSFTLVYTINRNPDTGELHVNLVGIDDWTMSGGVTDI